MKAYFKKNKWFYHWSVFAILVSLFVFTAIFFENKSWVPNLLQTIGTVLGIYLTIIIFLFSKEDSDKQFREHIEHLQALNTKQIDALFEATEKQIKALQELTEKQIEALHKTTFDQITAFEQQTREVTNKLSDNSILLAEILGRELEKSIDVYNSTIKNEEAKLNDLSGWKLWRTPLEREQQLSIQWNRIQEFKNIYKYLVGKYNQVRRFLGFGTKQLNG